MLIQSLLSLCQDKLDSAQPVLAEITKVLLSVQHSNAHAIPLDGNALQDTSDQLNKFTGLTDLPIGALVPAIVKFVENRHNAKNDAGKQTRAPRPEDLRSDGLPKRIVSQTWQ